MTIAASAIHGHGVFTVGPIPAGHAVIRFGGHLFPLSARYDVDAVQPGSAVGVAEFVLLGGHPMVGKDLSDYLNHSCSPNLGMTDAVNLVTLCDIATGEELTVDYAYWEADPGYVMKNACDCESARCRRRVTGQDWRLFERHPHLVQWSAPFIRRRIHGLMGSS
ncbi:SET domain-containing protein [Sphaerisporangium siamense]|uniref:SET domain-containing protein n=1 Tax=Sphaerisporangium siamense TaxID=795645 RepID=A0A7W7D2P5_9ACTN|nr:SET domain-containing protein-lysine N-methyltransferase [Sphaerisporangium siamense]MBB4699225.1 hypothetical protein [Sphaerisporangium siamense]